MQAPEQLPGIFAAELNGPLGTVGRAVSVGFKGLNGAKVVFGAEFVQALRETSRK